MFYDEKRPQNSAMLLSLFLDISYKEALENIKLIKGELNINRENDKVLVTDCAIELFNNTINLEMNRKQVTERNVIYLDKWKKYYNKSELTYRERYILVLTATKLSVAKNIARGDEFLMETIKQLKELEENTKIIKVYDCEKVCKEEGREEGREEMRLENAKALICAGIDIKAIKKALKLSDEDIKQLNVSFQ